MELVDSSGHPISFNDYFNTKAAMALKGSVYNPTLGFATIGNVGARATSIQFYSRLNGVGLVLLPLLGLGLASRWLA